jgi:hypothetical protein
MQAHYSLLASPPHPGGLINTGFLSPAGMSPSLTDRLLVPQVQAGLLTLGNRSRILGELN